MNQEQTSQLTFDALKQLMKASTKLKKQFEPALATYVETWEQTLLIKQANTIKKKRDALSKLGLLLPNMTDSQVSYLIKSVLNADEELEELRFIIEDDFGISANEEVTFNISAINNTHDIEWYNERIEFYIGEFLDKVASLQDNLSVLEDWG